MEINMNFLEMLEDSTGMHHGALKEINFNETKYDVTKYDRQYMPPETVIPEYMDKMAAYTMDGMVQHPGVASKKMRMQRCAHEGCEEVTYKSRTSRNWVCKSHQTKMNKDMLKKRLEERCRTPVAEGGVRKKEAGLPGRPGGSENVGPSQPTNPFRPSLLEEVLNEKKMTLMRSPDVVAFLRAKQKKVEERKRLEHRLNCEPADTVSSSSSGSSK